MADPDRFTYRDLEETDGELKEDSEGASGMDEKTEGGDAGSASPSGMTKVSVAIRVRPLIDREQKAGAQAYWQVGEKELRAIDPETKRLNPNGPVFAYDHVFDKTTQTKEVYDRVVAPIVRKSFKGFNGTILCYGQTSSGKTHTLYGSNNDKGIILLFAEHLFTHIQADQGRRQYIIKVGLIEIYNEKVTDLLNSENPIDLVEREGTVVPHGVEEITVFTQEDIIKVAQRIQRERKIGETRMNKESSRSHTILRVTIESFDLSANLSYNEANSDQSPPLTTAVLHFVDLAGSEKQNQTGAEGVRFQEQININKSLSSLSLVIKQLSDSAGIPDEGTLVKAMCNSVVRSGPKSQLPKYINFRDSKLTRLLQSTLNGEACTSMICNVTIASLDETKSTLVFARQAKTINISPKQNLSNKLEYEKKLKELQDMLNCKDKEMSALRKQFENLKQAFQVRSSSQSAINDRRLSLCPSLLSRAADPKSRFSETTSARAPRINLRVDSCTSNQRMSTPTSERFLNTNESLSYIQRLTSLREQGHTFNDETCSPHQMHKEVQTDFQSQSPPSPSVTAAPSTHCRHETPLRTLRLTKAILTVANENDKREWMEEKEFLEAENQSLKAENLRLSCIEGAMKQLTEEKLELENDVVKQIQASKVEVKRRTAEVEEELKSVIARKDSENLGLRNENLELERRMAQLNEDSTSLTESMKSQLLDLTTKLTATGNVPLTITGESQTDSDSERSQWMEEREFLNTEIQSLKTENLRLSRMEDAMKQLTEEKLELENDVKQLQDCNAKHKRRTADIEAELNSLTAQKDSEISELKDQKLKLENDVVKQIQQCQEVTRRTTEIEAELNSIIAKKDSEISELKDEKVKSENEIAKQIEEYKEKLERRTAEVEEELTSLIAEKDSENLGLRNEKLELNRRIASLTEESTSLTESMKSQLLDLTTQLAVKDAENESLKTENLRLSRLEEVIKQLTEEKLELENDVKQMQECIVELERRTAEVETERNYLIAEKDSEILGLNDEKLELERRMANLNEESTSLTESMKSQLLDLTTKLTAKGNPPCTVTCESQTDPDSEWSHWKEEREFLETENQSLKTENLRLSRLEDAMKQLTDEKLKLENDAVAQIQESKAELQRRTAEIAAERNSLIAQKDSEISRLQDEKLELERCMANSEEESTSVTESMKSQLLELTTKLAAKQIEVQSLKTENLRLSCLEDAIKQLTEEKLELENDVKLMEECKVELARRTAEFETERNSLLAQKDSEISELKDENLKLENDVIKQIQQCQEVTRRTTEIEAELNSIIAIKDSEISDLKDERVKSENDVAKQIDEYKEKLERRTAEVEEELTSLIAEKDSENLGLRNEKLELNRRIASLTEESTSLAESMKSQQLDLTTQLAAKQTEVQSLKTENLRLSRLEDQLTEEKLKLESDAVKQIQECKVELERRTAEIEAQRNSLIARKDSEISRLKDEKLELQHDVAKQVKECQVEFNRQTAEIKAELNSVTAQKDSEISRLKDEKLELERRIANLNEESTSATESMKAQLLDLTTKLAAKRKGSPLTVNRESQTDSYSEVLEALKNCRIRIDFLKHEGRKLTVANAELKRERDAKIAELTTAMSEKDVRLKQFEERVDALMKRERAPKHENESGVQCDLLNELIERSSRGERGLLPDYIPDVAQLRYDLKRSQNKSNILVMELANVKRADNPSPFSHIGSSSSARKERPIGGVVAKYKRPAGHVSMGYQSHALPVGFGSKLMGTAKLPRFGEPVASSSRRDEQDAPLATAQDNAAPNKENLAPQNQNLVPPSTPGLRNSKVDVQTESNCRAMPLSGSSSQNTREPDGENEDPLKPDQDLFDLMWNACESPKKPGNQENVPPPIEVYPTPAPGAYGGNEFSQTAELVHDDSVTKPDEDYRKFLMEL